MARPFVVALSISCLATLVAACSAAPGDDAAAVMLDAPLTAHPASKPSPWALLPLAPGVADACAPELGTTYCSEVAADEAGARCAAKLDASVASQCDEGACTRSFAADRATCHEGKTYPTAASCAAPVVDDCSFYRSCLDAGHPCGDSGYALGYGERLCYSFIEHTSEFTDEGVAWLHEVRSCLQRQLVPLLDEPATCTTLLDEAYATHAGCYTAPESSLCELPTSDLFELTRLLGTDLLNGRALAQIHDVARTCLVRWLGFGGSAVRSPQRDFFEALERASTSETSLRGFLATERAKSVAR